jgi:adenosylhomocysteine nucleosidase
MGPQEAGESRSRRRDERKIAPAPVPADVGVVAALPIEVGDLIDRLRRIRNYHSASVPIIEGEYAGRIVVVAVGGAGRAAARRAADLLLAGHQPRWLVSAGFAGALNPTLARNDLVMAHEIIDPEGHRFPVAIPETLASLEGSVQGRLLTVDRIILQPDEKQELRRATGADLVDMESSAVAALCSQKLLRFVSVRVISDDAAAVLPREVATLLSHTGSYRLGAAIRALWQRPASLKDFWTLHERAIEASDRLAKFLVRCLTELPT